MSSSRRNCLLGLHAFTGNDYVSSILRKRKERCWKLIKENSNFEQTFASLGNSELLSDTLFTELQECVCCLYGYPEKSVDAFCYKLFKKKQC